MLRYAIRGREVAVDINASSVVERVQGWSLGRCQISIALRRNPGASIEDGRLPLQKVLAPQATHSRLTGHECDIRGRQAET